MRFPKFDFTMGSRTLVQEEITLTDTSPTVSTTDDVVMKSEEPVFTSMEHQEVVEEPYEPPPVISRSSIVISGSILFLLAKVWPPLLLIVTYIVSLIIPYSYRTNDDATTRRQYFTKFENEDQVSAHLRALPADVKLEERYWTNPR